MEPDAFVRATALDPEMVGEALKRTKELGAAGMDHGCRNARNGICPGEVGTRFNLRGRWRDCGKKDIQKKSLRIRKWSVRNRSCIKAI